MRKKYAENSEEENEFDVDEPEEIQNNASDDDWTPDKDNSGGRRTSTRLRNIPRSRAPIIDASSTDEEGSDESQGWKRKGGKGRGKGRPPMKKHKVSSTSTPGTPVKSDNNLGKSVGSDSEPSSTTTLNSSATPTVIKVNKEFTSGAFVVLKADAAKLEQEPPLWKIDGKALLQKYIAFDQDGKTLYKNTSVYSGWTMNNKDNYYPVSVIFKQQTRKEHIVEFHRDQLKLGGSSAEVTSSSPEEPTEILPDLPDVPDRLFYGSDNSLDSSDNKPIIKVKAFAVVSEEESKTPATPVVEKPAVPDTDTESSTPEILKINKHYSSGAFLVTRKEAANVDPPLWKIDGKALLQKYVAFNQHGKVLYKNTPEYSGWSLNNRTTYFPAAVIFKRQDKNGHIVELERIKWDEPDD